MFKNQKENTMVKSYNLSEIGSLIDEFEQDINHLNILAKEIKSEKGNASINKKLKRFLSEYERIFLKYKVLNLYVNKDLNKEMINSFVQNDPLFCGVNNSFNSRLTVVNQDYLVYTLPPFFGKRNFENGSYIGDFFGNIIQRLTIDFLKNDNKYFHKIDKGTIVFEHHIDSDNEKNNLIDPDNIDAKKALDGLNGLVLEDDSILNINLIHISKNDNFRHTKIHVIRNNYMKQWLSKNLELFEKK